MALELVGQVLKNIFSVGEAIYNLVSRARNNDRECQSLEIYIKQLLGPLKKLEGQRDNSDQLIGLLLDFQSNLEDIQRLMEEYSQHNQVTSVMYAPKYYRKFSSAQTDLDRTYKALILALTADISEQHNIKWWKYFEKDDKQWKQVKADFFVPWNIRVISPEELTLGPLLSSSSSHELYVGQYQFRTVLIKELKGNLSVNEKEVLKEFKSECEAIKKYQHPNVLQLFGICTGTAGAEPRYTLVMEYCEKGTLRDVLRRDTLTLDWTTKLGMALDAAVALDCLHHPEGDSILHGSLSSRKFLVNGSYFLKLSGFEFSKTETSMRRNPVKRKDKSLDLAYFAPEIMKDFNNHDRRSEIFSLGVVLYEIATGKLPLEGRSDVRLDDVYSELCDAIHAGLPADCPPLLHDLIGKCLQRDPEKRPTAKTIADRLISSLKPRESMV